MSRVVTIKDVPSDHKDEVVAVERAGGADVHVFDNRGGTFTVVANFPDETDLTSAQKSTSDGASKNEGKDILATARPHIGEQYIFGSSVAYTNRNWKGPWDCAEFMTWCVFQTYGFFYGCDAKGTAGSTFTGKWKKDAQTRGQLISVENAMHTPGAFLLRYPATGNSAIGHIVISKGDGSTIEAADHIHGVIAGTAFGRRWDTGVLLPSVQYGAAMGVAPQVIRSTESPNPDPNVMKVQLALTKLGPNPGPVDGVFSNLTESAVVAFQQQKGLVVDGEVGPATAAALFGAAATLGGTQASSGGVA